MRISSSWFRTGLPRFNRSHVICILAALLFTPALTLAQGDNQAFLDAYKKMLPKTAYSANRTMTFSGNLSISQTGKIYYTPYKERAEMQMNQPGMAGGIKTTTITLYDEGTVWTMMGAPLNTASSTSMEKWNDMKTDVKGNPVFKYEGKGNVDGTPCEIYSFNTINTDGTRTVGKLYRDSQGIPRRISMNMTDDKGALTNIEIVSKNVVVAAQPASLFEIPASNSRNSQMLGGMGIQVPQQSPYPTSAPPPGQPPNPASNPNIADELAKDAQRSTTNAIKSETRRSIYEGIGKMFGR